MILLCLVPGLRAAVDKPVLELAPTLAELGKEWTTNQVVLLIDPLGKLPEAVDAGNPDPKGLLRTFRNMMRSTGRTGYLRMHYGRGDLVVNRGAYHVYLQRWTSSEVLNRRQFQESESIPRRAPDVGQTASWKRTEMYDNLVFQRDQYLVIIEFGRASDYTYATRLAELIDAKIVDRAVPK
jgi:hypothetical protein